MTRTASTLRIVLSMGDPGGIGPEIIARVLADHALWLANHACPVVVGDSALMIQVLNSLGIVPVPTAEFVLAPGMPLSVQIAVGRVSAANGQAALAALRCAHDLVHQAKTAHALVTAPISKEAIHLAGCTFPGHTELLAQWCGLDPDRDVRMMLAIPGLRVVLHTIHIPLAQVPSSIAPEALLRTFELTQQWCATYGQPNWNVAVCGLNPHAGENGHIGTEDRDILLPAIRSAQQLFPSLSWSGPHPGDTIFARALAGEFDIVLAMYHDQGLIPVKTLDMHHGVNLTVGLPYLRTSPDHGTAFDLAGRGVANPESLRSAIEMAIGLAARHSSGIPDQP